MAQVPEPTVQALAAPILHRRATPGNAPPGAASQGRPRPPAGPGAQPAPPFRLLGAFALAEMAVLMLRAAAIFLLLSPLVVLGILALS